MEENKLISIIIATYNAVETIERCLDSIVPQITSECELIIIDGLSKDDTIEKIKHYQDKISFWSSEPDKGIYDAWNKGINVASGQWVAFIGADDVLLPGAIQSYLDVIKSTPNIDSYDYICAHNEYVDVEGNFLKLIGDEPKWSSMRKCMVAAHVASLHNKKNLFDTVGLYDYEHFKICADYELLMRKRDSLRYLIIPAHIARMKTGGMSFSTKAIKETYQIRKKHKSVSKLYNIFLYFWGLFAFDFFIFRKKLQGGKFS